MSVMSGNGLIAGSSPTVTQVINFIVLALPLQTAYPTMLKLSVQAKDNHV